MLTFALKTNESIYILLLFTNWPNQTMQNKPQHCHYRFAFLLYLGLLFFSNSLSGKILCDTFLFTNFPSSLVPLNTMLILFIHNYCIYVNTPVQESVTSLGLFKSLLFIKYSKHNLLYFMIFFFFHKKILQTYFLL